MPKHLRVSRLAQVPGIGVDRMGSAADAAHDPEILRLENLDTDIPPPSIAIDTTRTGVDKDENNSYLPFLGQDVLRQAAVERVSRSLWRGIRLANRVYHHGWGDVGDFELSARYDRAWR